MATASASMSGTEESTEIATVVRSHVVRGGRANWRGAAMPGSPCGNGRADADRLAGGAAAWPFADPVMCRVLGDDEVYPVASASAYEERRPPAPGCWVASRC